MKKQIKTLKDYQELLLFVAINAHNLLLDSHIPGEKIEHANTFMKKCREIAKQLEDSDE